MHPLVQLRMNVKSSIYIMLREFLEALEALEKN